MARNEEKARPELNCFTTMKALENKTPRQRRPYLASECTHLSDAQKWHQQILRQIERKVADIQYESLGEYKIRELNDEINKLFREKSHWEKRVRQLGGPNYQEHAAKMMDLEGNCVAVPNPRGRGPGYRYFGAAKLLPGVKELFEKPPQLRKRKTRYGIYKRMDASYYGYTGDEVLEASEGPAEEKMRTSTKDEIVEKREFVVHVPLPDSKEIERMVLEKKKIALLSQNVRP